MQDTVPTQRVGEVLDPDGRRFGGAKRVDAEQERQHAMVHGESLGDFQEPNELKPVDTLGACLVGVDLGQPGVDGGVGGDPSVDVPNRKNPRTPCSMVLIEESRSPLS